jgi:hypothetical protein
MSTVISHLKNANKIRAMLLLFLEERLIYMNIYIYIYAEIIQNVLRKSFKVVIHQTG